MNNIPTNGMRIVNQRTGEEFIVTKVSDVKENSLITKALASLAVCVLLTLAVSVLCRLTRKLFT